MVGLTLQPVLVDFVGLRKDNVTSGDKENLLAVVDVVGGLKERPNG